MHWWGLGFFVISQMAAAAPLPFEDGFETPDGGFPLWTGVAIDAPNTLATSTEVAFSGARSMKVGYAGDIGVSPSANTVLDLDARAPALFVRFHLYVPASTAAAFPPMTWVRLVRFGDTSGMTGNPIAETQIWSDNLGTLFVRATNTGSPGLGSPTTTPIQSDRWLYVEDAFEPALSRHRLFVGDPLAPKAEVDGGVNPTQPLSVRVGFPYGASATGTQLTWYIDEVSIRETGPIGPATPVPPVSDGGVSDGGSLATPQPGVYRVGCGCGTASGALLALCFGLLLRRRRAFG